MLFWVVLGEICLTIGTPMWVAYACFAAAAWTAGIAIRDFINDCIDSILDQGGGYLLIKEDTAMRKGNIHKKATFEDRFDRKYACWVKNNPKAWHWYKVKNRRDFRRKVKRGEYDGQQQS